MMKNISYTYLSITDHGIELLLETDNAKSSGMVVAAESSDDDQAYDSRWFWSLVTKPVHEIMSIANIMSLGQHFITFALTIMAADQHTHATNHTVTYARAIITLWRRYRSKPKTANRVSVVAVDHSRAFLLLLHHNYWKTKMSY